MSAVLAVTGDPNIREHLHAYADLLSTPKLASMPTTPELIVASANRGWRAWEPVYAVFLAEEQELIGFGFTRFHAQVHAWQHQTARRSELLPEGGVACVVSGRHP
ncbi:hypothetical protein [Micromonospora sp. NPDC049107]|uniref:hypothetical protein n=1 Tax=unclassified Micromonospora TaxID=2617518 RepID=UPI0033F93FFB